MKSHKLYTELQQKLEIFYRNYYFDTLKLHDWKKRFESFRVDEEINIGKKFFEKIDSKMGSVENKKILIVGAGTGAEGLYLALRKNCHITLMEPDSAAIEILKLKVQIYNLDNVEIYSAYAEKMPFLDNQFDLIVCYTVLEHVSDYQKSIDEMYRCVNKNGQIILFLPNYAYPEEPHYKIKTFPPAYFKGLARIHLKLKKRYTPFFESINFLTSNTLEKFLEKRGFNYSKMKVLPNFKQENFFIVIYSKLFGIERNQQIFIEKD